MFVVFYGRFIQDKTQGIHLEGTYYGGIAEDLIQGNAIAKNCVETVRGAMVVPRVLPMIDGATITDLIPSAVQKLRALEREMIEAEDITDPD